MLRTLIVLPGGRELFSGAPGAAVVSASVTRAVNEGSELSLGAVCPGVFTCRLTEATEVSLRAGDPLTVYQVDEDNIRHLLGVFLTEKPVRSGFGILELTAYDRLSLLEQDLSGWLAGLEQWPYTLSELAQMTCAACGLTLVTPDIPNGGCPVQKFSGRGITGKRLMQWVGQLCGRFSRATPQGDIELACYSPLPDIQIDPTGDEPVVYTSGDLCLNGISSCYANQGVVLLPDTLKAVYDGVGDLSLTLPGTLFYYQDSLCRLGEAVQPIERVHLRRSAADVGTVWPEREGNTYLVSGNCLLSAVHDDDLLTVAMNLYDQLKDMTYTPCQVTVPATAQILPGHILSVTDLQGQRICMYVMKTVTRKGRTTLHCTGSARRDTPDAIRDLQVKAESGKLLELEADVDGLRVQNTETAGKLTRLELDIDGIRSRVTHQEETDAGISQRLSQVEQTASSVDIAVKSVLTDGVDRVVTKSGYSFTDEGLIISKQGHQMQNLLDHTGMYVTRDEEVILQASHRGVEARDVKVHNYLIVGEHARFEDYDNGTACFYI